MPMHNLALKQYSQVDFTEEAEHTRAVAGHWFKVLGAVVLSAWLMTVVAVASLWLKLEIDQKYQRIDSIKIRNVQLKTDIQKLEAEAMQLKSLEKIEENVAAAGVIMEKPNWVFFVDPNQARGQMAMGTSDSSNGAI